MIAALNKRNGQVQRFEVKPGNAVSFGGLTIRRPHLRDRAAVGSAKQTAAFLQIDEAVVQPRTAQRRSRNPLPRRVFSGWMFAESPSLNPLADPLYDVWVKSCTMSFPDTGPGTVVAVGRQARPPRQAQAGPRRRNRPLPDTADANRSFVDAPRDLDRPELREVVGQELRVEQP